MKGRCHRRRVHCPVIAFDFENIYRPNGKAFGAVIRETNTSQSCSGSRPDRIVQAITIFESD